MARWYSPLAGVRRGVEAAVLEQVARYGVSGVRRNQIVAYACRQGVSRRAAYRWISNALADESGTNGPMDSSLDQAACRAVVEAILREQVPGIAAAVAAQLSQISSVAGKHHD